MKRLKNTEDTTKDQIKSQLKPIENSVNFLNRLGADAKEKLDEIKKIDKEINYTKLVCVHTNGKAFDYNIFRRLGDFIRSIYFDNISLKQAMDKQDEMEYLRRNLGGYKPRHLDKIRSKEEVLKNAHIFFQGRNLLVYACEKNIFPLPKKEMPQLDKWTEEEKGKEYISPKERLEIIAEEEKGINNNLFQNYFKYKNPSYMYENFTNTKSTKERNKI